jgi:5'-nucleotidase
VNNFIAAGGDNFTVLPQGTNQVGGPVDLDVLITWVQAQPQPLAAPALGRITRAQ